MKVTKEDIQEVKALLKKGFSATEIVAELGIPFNRVSYLMTLVIW